jgi:hypothetical protein
LALVEDNVPDRIYAAGQKRSRHLADVGFQNCRILEDRYCMEIDYAENAVMRILERHELMYSTQIIAKVKITRWLNARKHPLRELSHFVATPPD